MEIFSAKNLGRAAKNHKKFGKNLFSLSENLPLEKFIDLLVN